MNEDRRDNFYLDLTKPETEPAPVPVILLPESVRYTAPPVEEIISVRPDCVLPQPDAQPQLAYETEYQAEPERQPEPEYRAERQPAPEPRRGGYQRRRAPKNGGFSRGMVAAALLCCVLLAGAAGFAGGFAASRLNQTSPSHIAAGGQSSVSAELLESYRKAAVSNAQALTTAEISAVAADSVVEIVTETEVMGYNFWGRSSGSRTQTAAGSGVIISADGYIITNNHVIENANKIEITLRNGQGYAAELVATDATTDVAVLKIEAGGLAAVTIGDSGALVVGEQAVVIGNPLGRLGGTVTSGVISALDRPITFQEDDGSTKTMNLLQTDAAINSGNSGGGLFNSYGELVGIVVAKSGGIGVEGIGFAIPVNDVRGVIDDLISYGYARGRVALGVQLVTIDSEQAMNYYRVEKQGVYIYRVEKNSNAERAGLEQGDLLLAVDGVDISSGTQVIEKVQSLSVGDKLSITYEREGARHSVNIVMDETVPEGVSPQKTNS